MKVARIAEGMTDEVKEVENFFSIARKGHRCDITLLEACEILVATSTSGLPPSLPVQFYGFLASGEGVAI